MQRNLRACFRSIGIVIRTCNFSEGKEFVAVHVGKMHKGGKVSILGDLMVYIIIIVK